jgi:phosphoserine phosphatase
MKVALFLDVDKTLTRNYIQHDYARALECESEYCEIEKQFQTGALSSQQFGERLIRLFASKGFNAEQAEALFKKVHLQPWADQLLRFKVDKYLVSSGPSYYIDKLAHEYNIPLDRVCRSDYRFDRRTALIRECSSISEMQKATFVSEHAAKYDVTIGIGDSPRFDGPFVSNCTIALLTEVTDTYIYIPNFNSAINLIQKMTVAADEPPKDFKSDTLTLPQLVRILPISGWAAVAGILIALLSGTFTAGIKLGPLLSASSSDASPTASQAK